MARSFIEELDHVQAQLMKMGSVVQETIRESITCLREQDGDAAKRIINADDVIDNYQIVVEEGVSGLFGLQPPVSSDLRRFIAFIKVAGDLERVGDYAANIAEITLELRDEDYIKPLVHIPELAGVSLGMLKTSLDAFVDSDAALAEAVCQRDDEADELFNCIYEELAAMLVSNPNRQVGRQAPRLMRVAEHLERVGDHATNISEQTIYIVTGKRVKY